MPSSIPLRYISLAAIAVCKYIEKPLQASLRRFFYTLAHGSQVSKVLSQFLPIIGVRHGGFHGDLPLVDHAHQVHVQRVHAGGAAGLHDTAHLVALVLADHVAGRVGAQEQLGGGDAAAAVHGGHETLGDDALEDAGQLGADLILAAGRAGVDDTVDGLGGAGGVQCGQHQMAGLGGGERRGDGLEVSHLTDEDDIRVLTEGAAQGGGEGHGVPAGLPLMDQRLFPFIDILHRVLDGDDVHRFCLVDVFDHGRQGGGFTTASGAGDEHKSPGLLGQLVELWRQVQLLQGRYVAVEQTDGGRHLTLLAEDIDPLATAVGGTQGEIDVIAFVKAFLLLVTEQTVEHLDHLVLGGLHWCIDQHSVDAQLQGKPCRHMNIRRFHFPRHEYDPI